MSPLFDDVVQCMLIQVLEIKKSEPTFHQATELLVWLIKLAVRRRRPLVVYLYLVNYGRTKADSIHHAISGFLSVSSNLACSQT